MNEPDTSKIPGGSELDAAQAEIAAGGWMCSGTELVNLTENLIQAYENLVDFTSHVIGRVAGE